MAKQIFIALFAIFSSVSGAFAQSTGPSGQVPPAVQIVIEAPSIANRQSVLDLVDELTTAGFTYIEIHRTFLGRARIVAYSATEIREVIINPTTGEVLREVARENLENVPKQAPPPHANSASQNGNKGINGNNGNNGNAGGANRNR